MLNSEINMDADEEMQGYISEISRELNNIRKNSDQMASTLKRTVNKKKSHNLKVEAANGKGWTMLFWEVLASLVIAGSQVYFIKGMLSNKLVI